MRELSSFQDPQLQPPDPDIPTLEDWLLNCQDEDTVEDIEESGMTPEEFYWANINTDWRHM